MISPDHEISTQASRNGLRILEAHPVLVKAVQANVSDLQGEPAKLMPLNYTLLSLRTTDKLGGHLFRSSTNCSAPCLIGRVRALPSFVFVRLFHRARGAKACNEITGSISLSVFGTFWGCCIRAGDTSNGTSQ